MPHPYPGQEWKHGWIPVTPAAVVSKNHGRKPGKNSALSRIIAEAGESAKKLRDNARRGAGPESTPPPKWTGIGRKPSAPKSKAPTSRPDAPAKPAPKAPEAPKAATAPKPPTKAPAKPAPAAAPKAAPKAAAASKPDPAPKTPGKPATKPAKAAKVGTDSRNTPLRVGDDVNITEGPNRGKTGRVTGKGKSGAVKVDVDGTESDFSPMNLRSRSDQETSRKVDAGIRAAAGRPTPENRPAPAPAAGAPQSIEKTQGQIRDAYNKLAPKPGDWVSLTKLRPMLAKELGRDHVDEALRKLNRMPNVNFVPEANQKALRPADRAAAVHIGEQDKHLISFI